MSKFADQLLRLEMCEPHVPASLELAYISMARIRMKQWEERRGLEVLRLPDPLTIDPQIATGLSSDFEKEISSFLPDREYEPIDLPRFHIDDVPTDPLSDEYPAVPFVVENLVKDSVACQNWNLEYFAERYGDATVICADATDAAREIKLKDCIDSVWRGESYVHNSAALVAKYPQVVEEIGVESAASRLSLPPAVVHHLFVGNMKAGGWHAANLFNMFINVVGHKTWYLIHPKYTAWIPGVLHFSGQNGYPRWRLDGSDTDTSSAMDPGVRDTYPSFYKIPKFRTKLNPGDVLINPPWWWHSVHNDPEPTIGFATRRVPARMRRLLEFFTMNQAAARVLHPYKPNATDKTAAKVFMDWDGVFDSDQPPSATEFTF